MLQAPCGICFSYIVKERTMQFNDIYRKRRAQGISFPEDYVVLDLETTGLSPSEDEIIDIAAVRYISGEKVAEFNTYVKPKSPIPAEITELTGIDDSAVKDAPEIEEALTNLSIFLNPDDLIVGHNVGFDIRFLATAYSRMGIDFMPEAFDTCAVSRRLYPELPKHRLIDLMQAFGIRESQSHTAFDDCEMCNACLIHMKEDCAPLRSSWD